MPAHKCAGYRITIVNYSNLWEWGRTYDFVIKGDPNQERAYIKLRYKIPLEYKIGSFIQYSYICSIQNISDIYKFAVYYSLIKKLWEKIHFNTPVGQCRVVFLTPFKCCIYNRDLSLMYCFKRSHSILYMSRFIIKTYTNIFYVINNGLVNYRATYIFNS